MHAIDRKLLRDIVRMRGQVVTIALVLAAGVAAYLGLSGTYAALRDSRDAYYARYEFPDVFVHLERAPDGVAARLAELPGVAEVQPRLVERATFLIPGMARPATGRAISLGAGDAALRGLALRRGRAPEPGRDDEVVVLASFADAHGLEPGDVLTAVIAGTQLRLRVAGVALSPEFVFPGEAGFGDQRAFGVIWMPREALATVAGRHGAFDDAVFRLVPGADEVGVIEAIDRVLAPWGGTGAYGRDLQTSHLTLTGELQQLDVLARQVPIVFLVVAAFLLHVVLNRIVQLQREQLAVLRALGYTRLAVGRHVLAFASVIVVCGAVLGVGFGVWMGRAMLGLYAGFFHFPVISVRLDGGLVATGLVVCGGAAVVGAGSAAWRAIRLAPAEAMRPPVPARYRRGWLSRLGIGRVVGPLGRMIVREVERRPVAFGVSICGIAFAGGIVILGRFSVDSVGYLIDVIMARSMREDVAVTLATPVPRDELAWFRHAPGVRVAEPMRTAPVRLRAGPRHRDVAITAWPRDGALRQVLDGDARPVPLPADGLLLTAQLAKRLGVAVGDPLVVERLDGDRRTLRLPVVATVDERMGLNAYMDLDALAAAFGEPPRIGTVLLDVDPAARDALLATLNQVPDVAIVTETSSFRDAYEAQSARTVLVFSLIVAICGSVIAVGVVYNTARVALSERGRDLATLRVLGFTRDEVATVLIGQLALQVVLAVPVGLVLGHGLASAFMAQMNQDQFRFPAIVSPSTDGFAALIVLGAAIATAGIVRRRLDRIDLVGALKARD